MTDQTLVVVAPPFVAMAHRIVWCTAATTDREGLPRTRIVHPIWQWDGTTLQGWLATSPNSLKAKHLAVAPMMSLTYFADNHDTCSVECATEWLTAPAERAEGWNRFLNAPDPVGYDPSIIPTWESPESPDFGVLHLAPVRVRVMPGSMMLTGQGDLLTWSTPD